MTKDVNKLEEDGMIEVEDSHRHPQDLGSEGVKAIQGKATTESQADSGDIPTDGHAFEKWANAELFAGRGRRLNVNPGYNQHLNNVDESELGLTNERRTDLYDDERGEIWEIKSGYEKAHISDDQIQQYQVMLDAGYVYEKVDNTGGKEDMVKRPVKNVNYLFRTEVGARNNASQLMDHDMAVLYLDERSRLQSLE